MAAQGLPMATKLVSMITVISASNRQDNFTRPFAEYYYTRLQQYSKEPVAFLALDEITENFIDTTMYAASEQAPVIARLQDEFILPARKFVFVLPEYNGSYPGVLKAFFDAVSVREYKASFAGKKAALIGTSSGRAGNLRGIDHFGDVLNHVGIVLYPNKLPVSGIKQLLDPDLQIADPVTLEVLDTHARAFVAF
jgi:NAD(P)H-dependent FMN reductase